MLIVGLHYTPPTKPSINRASTTNQQPTVDKIKAALNNKESK